MKFSTVCVCEMCIEHSILKPPHVERETIYYNKEKRKRRSKQERQSGGEGQSVCRIVGLREK